MLRTLFYIPDQIGGWPVFGVGWLLGLWLVFSVGNLLLTVWRHGWDRDASGQIPMLLMVAAAIALLLPRIVEPVVSGFPVFPPVDADHGLPIRGYGVMLLLAVVTGVGSATERARRAGLASEVIYSLAFVMVLGGLLGARLLFVIQYWSHLRAETWTATLANLVSIDKGGLVVYGSLIGALVAFGGFCWRYRIAPLPLADLIAPHMAVGLAIGRIGCLLNGCCFGGPCDYAWAITFPPGSPPYQDQQGWGEPFGFRLAEDEPGQVTVRSVDPSGVAAQQGLRAGDRLAAVNGDATDQLGRARELLEQASNRVVLTLHDGRRIRLELAALPLRSRPVHPTQLYSSFNAALLCALSLVLYPLRRKHGQIFATLISLYALTRFLEEIIRTDEGNFFATLTISQSISVAFALGMAGLWVYIQRQPNIPAAHPR